MLIYISHPSHANIQNYPTVHHLYLTTFPLPPLVKLRNNTPIPHPINLQHEPQPRTPHHHFEREVEVIEFDPPRRRQPREQALRHSTKVCRQRAHVDQITGVGARRSGLVAGDQIIGDNEGLSRPEVTRVMEGDGG